MELDIASWLGLAIRWVHVITGICWIGSSFYFIWLDNSLTAPEDEKDKASGVSGELWAVHGGGFYHKKKYQVAPAHMPEELHWFKWEAYFTWMSGFLLLVLMYYFGANLYLIDQAKYALEPMQATVIGLAFIGGGWLFYNILCQSAIGRNNRLFGAIWFVALTVAAYALDQIFTGRGAYIHIGAIIGTVMASNVFITIIPNQRKVVASLLAGQSPDPRLGKMAKQRSLHNNYMTLPVVLIMISNHYPMLFGNPHNWALLAGMGAVGLLIRHFFNLKHKGKEDYMYPLAGVALFIIVMFMAASHQVAPKANESSMQVSDAEIRAIIRENCSACHSDTPTHASVTTAPLGTMFDKMDEIRQYAARIKAQAVDSEIMPPGNETGMTAEDRAKLGAWIAAQEK